MIKARVGIVGTGHGIRTILPALVSTNKFEVCAVAGSSKERAQAHASKVSEDLKALEFEELLGMSDSLDLICIASPNEHHLAHFAASADTKCNLYLEKPLGNSEDEARQIESAFKGSSQERFLVVGHQLRFNPFIREMKRQWHEGKIGRVYSLSIIQRGGAFARKDREWTWEFEKSSGGGVRLAMGTHLVDLVYFLSSTTPKSLCVNMDAVHLERTPVGTAEVRTIDVCNSFVASLDGGSFEATVSTSAASHGPGKFEIEILGSEGALYYDGVSTLKAYREGQVLDDLVSRRAAEEYLALPGSSVFRKSLCKMAAEMAAAILGEKNNLSEAASLVDGLENLTLLDLGMRERNARIDGRKDMF